MRGRVEGSHSFASHVVSRDVDSQEVVQSLHLS